MLDLFNPGGGLMGDLFNSFAPLAAAAPALACNAWEDASGMQVRAASTPAPRARARPRPSRAPLPAPPARPPSMRSTSSRFLA